MSAAKPIRDHIEPPKKEAQTPTPSALTGGLAPKKPSQSSCGDISGVGNTGLITRSDQHLTATSVPVEPSEQLDEFALSRLREFFELLNRWDREQAGERIKGGNDKKGLTCYGP